MKAWYVYLPGQFHALDAYGDTEADARADMRDYLKVKRLPRGTALSPVPTRQTRQESAADRRYQQDYFRDL